MLRVEGVSVRFGGIHAVNGVDLTADAGHVTGLIGPNGAGKTTTFNVITGLQEATEGRLFLDDVEITNVKAHKRARMGMGRTFQRLEVFGSLSARDNVLVAAEIRRRYMGKGAEDPRAVTDDVLHRVGITHLADARVDSLPTGLARLVEVARALACRPRLLLLDEVGSGLDHNETEVLGDLLVQLARDGLALLLVEHDVDLVMRVCSTIHVLDFGRLIAVGPPDMIRNDANVQAAYLGGDVEGAA